MKRFVSIVLTLILCLSFAAPAFAETGNTTSREFVASAEKPDGPNRAEETEWVIRWADGLIQQRLWSITYGVWLTDWITIGYYDP